MLLITTALFVLDSIEYRWLQLQKAQNGQATVEYALIVLGAAAVALLVAAWAVKTGRIDALMDRVFSSVTDNVR